MGTLVIEAPRFNKVSAILLRYPEGYMEMALEDMAKFFPLEVGMPCGEIASWNDVSEVSRESVPCPCGNPEHWLVKHEVREAV